MTRTIFITLRALIVVATALTFRWLFLSNPTVIVGISEIHCHPVGWSYLGSTYSVDGIFDIDDSDTMERLILENSIEGKKEEEEVRDKVTEACNLVRDDRRLYMNLTVIFGVGAFLAVPKPTRKTLNLDFLRAKRKDDLSTTLEP